jgi:two-component system, NarL family, response regulator NreC
MIRVVVADDHAVVRAGIRAILQAEGDLVIVGEAGDGRSALEAVGQHRPDVLVVDLTMPESNGLDVIARVRGASPGTNVLVLSMHAAPEFVRGARRAGALGYVVKGSGLEDLVRAIRLVASGEVFLDATATAIERSDSLEASASMDDLERLTPREREVLQLVAEGYTNREIGDRLGVAAKTVDVHRSNVMRKLDLHTAQALTRFAIRRGIISSE